MKEVWTFVTKKILSVSGFKDSGMGDTLGNETVLEHSPKTDPAHLSVEIKTDGFGIDVFHLACTVSYSNFINDFRSRSAQLHQWAEEIGKGCAACRITFFWGSYLLNLLTICFSGGLGFRRGAFLVLTSLAILCLLIAVFTRFRAVFVSFVGRAFFCFF